MARVNEIKLFYVFIYARVNDFGVCVILLLVLNNFSCFFISLYIHNIQNTLVCDEQSSI